MSIEEVLQHMMQEVGTLSYIDIVAAKIMECSLQGGQMPSVALVGDCYAMAEEFVDRAKRKGKGTRGGPEAEE